jgi:16S rRNA (cytosine967-C5)-methyltransferase
MYLRPSALSALAFAIQSASKFEYPADRTLSYVLREHRVGSLDRPLVAEGFYAWLRHRMSVEAIVGDDAKTAKGDGRFVALALAAFARQFRRRITVPPGETDRYVKFLDIEEKLGPNARRELPAWLWDRLGLQYGEEERVALAEDLLKPAAFDLRVNTLKAKRDEVLQRLRKEGFSDARATPMSETGIRLQQLELGRVDISRHELFEDGSIEVQDEGSQLLANLVGAKRGEFVIDFCAGAGGKTLALAAMMASTGRLYAFDNNERRLDNLSPRLARSGASNVQTQRIENEHDKKLAKFIGKADRVLVDAPCSGLGTLKRNPDLKWRQSPASVKELTEIQKSILTAASKLVRSGGRLVYATCSLLAEENEKIAEHFLMTNEGWKLVPSSLRDEPVSEEKPYAQLLPHRDGCDGFFAAVFERA